MRHSHIHTAMVMIAMTLALSTAVLASATSYSYAAPRHPLALRTGTTPSAAVVLEGQEDVEVADFIIRGGREALTVETLTLQNCVTTIGRDNDGDCADTGETAGADEAVTSVTLVYNDAQGDTHHISTALADGLATFTDLVLFVPAFTEVPVAVYVDTAIIDDVTVTSDMQFQLNLNMYTAPFSAVMHTSGTVITADAVARNAIAETMTLRKTTPILTLSPASPKGFVEDGWGETFRLNIAAATTGDVTIDTLTFLLTITNNGGGNWNSCAFLGASDAHVALVDVATGETVPATWGLYDEIGVDCTASEGNVTYLTVTPATPIVTAAGTAYEYALYLDTEYANTTLHDNLRITLPEETDLEGLTTTFHAVTWSDGTSAGSTIDGTMVDELPVNGNLLVF